MRKWYKGFVICICLLLLILAGNYLRLFMTRLHTRLNSDTIVLRLAESMPEEHPSAQASKYFGELVEEETDGKIKIVVHYNSELGHELEVLEQMQFGGIGLARVNMTSLADIIPRLKVYMQPYLYEEPGDLLDDLNKNWDVNDQLMKQEKLEILSWYTPDKRCFYNNLYSIKSVEDFSDFKFRTPPSEPIINSVKRLGAVPRVIITGNNYDSILSNYIDGVESTLMEYCSDDYAAICKHLSISSYIYAPDALLASSVTFSRIPLNLQKIIRRCASKSIAFQKEKLVECQRKCVDMFIQNDGILVESEVFDKKIRPYLINSYEGNDNEI